MEPMRIALCYRAEDRDAEDVYYRVVPSGLLNIHGVLRRDGFASTLFNFTGTPWREIEVRLKSFSPRIAGVSHFTFNHASSAGLVRTIRRLLPGAISVAGGAQATFLDEELLHNPHGPDVVVRGEGEEPFLELARRVAKGEPTFDGLPGLSWLDRGALVRTPPGPLREDIDPYYDLRRFEAHYGVNPAEQFPFVITSRGCPADCTFCNSPRFWGRRVRFRSAASVVEEIQFHRHRYGLDYFGFRDDTFTAEKSRVRDICEAFGEQKIFVLWNCQSRVNLVSKDRLIWMRRAGCDQMQFGVESASPPVLARLHKSIRPDQVHRALTTCREVGIQTSAYFITGVPGQTAQDIEANRRLFSASRLMDGVVSPLCYYPGTELFERDRKSGLVEPDIFFQDDPERWLVRTDEEAKKHYQAMHRIIERARRGFFFRRADFAGHHKNTGVTFAGLIGLGGACEIEGDRPEALKCYVEVVRNWPESPWGYTAVVRWLERGRRRKEAKAWQECSRLAAHGEKVTRVPPWPEI